MQHNVLLENGIM